MKPLPPLPRFFTIGHKELANVKASMKRSLSGYLGGIPHGGYWAEKLAVDWCDAFKVKYAVPCNSATSGLLAACIAAGINQDSVVWVPGISMSATAACAKVLGASLVFIDIEPIRFSMNMNNFRSAYPKAIIVTNLFGHPAYLRSIRSWCDSNNVIMIEDNAQAPFAMEGDKYAGTIGHMGVGSFNVHKHIQAGEGGIVTTNDSTLADRLRGAINHGELGDSGTTGLNLRITEPVAAIACAQLARAEPIIAGRIDLAGQIIEMFSGVPWIDTPTVGIDCRHVFYIVALRIMEGKRDRLLDQLWRYNFPIRKGYAPTLNRVFNANQNCPIAQKLEDEEFITYEVCAHDPKPKHIRHMREIVKWSTDEYHI